MIDRLIHTPECCLPLAGVAILATLLMAGLRAVGVIDDACSPVTEIGP